MSEEDEFDLEPIEILELPLDAWHRDKGARMVEFAGYQMPIQYEGIMAEHIWTRDNAGLFDVSHMGQLMLTGDGVAEALEAMVPGDISALKEGKMRYSLLLAEDGGVLDDMMITAVPMGLYVVVNGAVKWDDMGYLRENLPDEITINNMEDRAYWRFKAPKLRKH
jgi:aminomethyltransferase